MSEHWVQHVSGQGKKFALSDTYDQHEYWMAYEHEAPNVKKFYYLPKSDYRECAPPERWIDVTGKCTFKDDLQQIWHQPPDRNIVVLGHGATNLYTGYRLRKVQLMDTCEGNLLLVETGKVSGIKERWAFVIEKKEPS